MDPAAGAGSPPCTPTGAPAPAAVWPPFTEAGDTQIVFDTTRGGGTFTVESGRRAKFCDFWDREEMNLYSWGA